MNILQISYPKSGTVWLWHIIEALQKEAGIQRKSWMANDPCVKNLKHLESEFFEGCYDHLQILQSKAHAAVFPVYHRPIENIEEYAKQTTHSWTHAPWSDYMPKVISAFDKTVFILRDPRDCFLSMLRFEQSDFMKKYFEQDLKKSAQDYGIPLQWLGNWLQHTIDHLSNAPKHNVLVMFYERMLANPTFAVRRLSDHLGYKVSDEATNRIASSTSFSSMRKKLGGHAGKGMAYGWMTEMPIHQQENFLEVIGPAIRILGYPLNDSNSASLPGLQNVTPETLKQVLDHGVGTIETRNFLVLQSQLQQRLLVPA